MPSQPVVLKPGVSTQMTKLLNEAGFSACQLIRFKDGMLQKLGGFAAFCNTPVTGVCRGMMANQDLAGNQYLVLGTNSNLEVFEAGSLYDITPVRATTNVSTPFTTTNTSKAVTVHDVGNGAQVGDGIYIETATAIDGVVIQGYYPIQSITDANDYVINIATAATSSVTSGGATALFTTTNTSPSVQVTLNNHGYVANQTFTVHVSTTVGGVTLFGPYTITSVTNANNFFITASANATSSTTGSENGGNVQIQYLIPSGPVSTIPSAGYGLGGYGLGLYGFGAPGTEPAPARQWHFAPFGEDMISSPTNGPLYLWLAGDGLINNPATIITQAPQAATAIFTAMPEQQVVAVGAESGGTQDPLLVRWCDVDDYTDWTATPVNQAGSFRLSTGSRIVGALQGPQQGLIWTDTSLWTMQYIQPPFIYGFNKLGDGYGLIASRAMGILANQVYWMGHDGFFVYTGAGINPVPCTVWDFVFQNLNQQQVEKITCAVNSSFNEVAWYFPSASGTGEVDSYVKYNALENLWDFGSLVRTAWIDQSVFTPPQPMGVDGNGYIQQHEISNDANGAPMVSYAQTGYFQLSESFLFIFMERMIPDFIFSNGASPYITVSVQDYPADTPTSQTYPVTSATEYLIIRQRGRLASLTIGSQDLGSFWRLGKLIYSGSSAGSR
jgi:hypothetical protein